MYLGSCVSAGDDVSDEIDSRMMKIIVAYAELPGCKRLDP